LAGNGETLFQRREDQKAMKQIEDRIDYTVEVGGMTAEDCELIAVAYNVKGNGAFSAVRNFGLQTNVRQLVRLIEHAQMLAGDQMDVVQTYTAEEDHLPEITFEHLEMASRIKRGRQKTSQL